MSPPSGPTFHSESPAETMVAYNGLKEMVQQNGAAVKEVPAEFMLPPHLQPKLSLRGHAKTVDIPIIDITGIQDDPEQRKRVVASIIEACSDWGFFQMVGHGVPVELRRKMLSLGRKFYELPVSEKVKYTNPDDVSKPSLGRTRSTSSGLQSWRDVFKHKSSPVSDDDVAKWPSNPESYRETVTEYTQEVRKLTTTLLELIGEGLNLKTRHFCDVLGGENNLQYVNMMAYYPRCPQPDLTLGLIGHSDPNVITMLIRDELGLEVRKDGLWVPVVPAPNGLVVNIGDALQIMTNGRCRSNEHRVLASATNDSVSVMAFVHPNRHTKVTVAKDLVPADTSPLYNDMTWGHFLKNASQNLDGKFTSFAQRGRREQPLIRSTSSAVLRKIVYSGHSLSSLKAQ